jgi:excisionase family DNA binding protein
MDDEILTLKELASYLKVAERTLYRLAQEQKVPGFKVGGAWRFRRTDIEGWIQEQTTSSTSKNTDLGGAGER